MNKKQKNRGFKTVIVILLIIVLSLSVYLLVNKPTYLRANIQQLEGQNQRLKEQLLIKSFAVGAFKIKTKDLKIELNQLEGELTNADTIDMLEYSVVYIYWCQIKLAENGIDYPVFILEAFLNDILEETQEGNNEMQMH